MMPLMGSAQEDITLYPQLGVLRTQPFQFFVVTRGHLAVALPSGAVALHPVPQRARVHPQVPGNLRDRLPGQNEQG